VSLPSTTAGLNLTDQRRSSFIVLSSHLRDQGPGSISFHSTLYWRVRADRSSSKVVTQAFCELIARSNNRQRSPLASRQALVFVLIRPHQVPDRYGLSQRFEATPSSPRVYPTCHLAARQPAFSASPSEQNQCLPFVRSILTFA
jgi:hypothetical protein